MIIRVKQDFRDICTEDPNHPRLTRRDFIERGLLTGAMSVVIPKMMVGKAMADVVCPAPVRFPGALAQYYCDGGGNLASYIMNNAMAEAAAGSITAATSYGIDGTALRAFGPNFVLPTKSPFGATLIAGPSGYTPAQWQAVLARCSFGPIVGPLNQDDGGMPDNLKMGSGLGKKSMTGKDILQNSSTQIAFATGQPASVVNNMSVANLRNTFSITPAATNRTNAQTMLNSVAAAQSLSTLFGGIFGLDVRKGGSNVITNANCGFLGNAPLVDPAYGDSLFNPLSTALTPILGGIATGLSTAEQAVLAAYYQSATGGAGAVVVNRGGYDYHNQDPTNNIAPRQVEAARHVVMFLAACDKAQAPGAFILTSNGSALCRANSTGNGNAAVTPNQTITTGPNSNGATTLTGIDTTGAGGDTGGGFNIVGVLYYQPPGRALVTPKDVGTISAGTGNVTSAPAVTSVLNAIAGGYLSAARHLGTSTMDLAKIEARIKSAGGVVGPNLTIT